MSGSARRHDHHPSSTIEAVMLMTQSWVIRGGESVVLFAAAVVVPLSVRLLVGPRREQAPAPIERALGALERVRSPLFALGPVGLLAALARPRGGLALVLSLPWVLATLALALQGLLRFVARPGRRMSDLAAVFACLDLPVGALWLSAYLGDLTVMGFAGIQCLLTAAHFHYAGFGARAVVALLGRELEGEGEGEAASLL